jgi:Zn-dependent protease
MFTINPTPFDIRLVAFRIPIRVHPSFWLGSLIFGQSLGSPELIFLWVICSFVSILIHELGHALTAEAYGWPTEIVLYFGGGLAMSQRGYNETPWKSILVSLMGPVAGFLLLGVIFVVMIGMAFSGQVRTPEAASDFSYYLQQALSYLFIMNLYWGLLNLIPVMPLDGGQIARSLCEVLRFRDPISAALKLGVVASGAATYYFLVQRKEMMPGMLMLMLCLQNVSALQTPR